MERTATARVDLQKLQVLNDRLALCLDALHQVRMSAQAAQLGYGFAPSYIPGYSPMFGQSYVPGFNTAPMQHGYNMSPIANWGIPGWQTAGIEGRSAYANGAYAQPYAPSTQIW